MLAKVTQIKIGVAAAHLALVVHSAKFRQSYVPATVAKNGSGAVAASACTIPVASTTVADLELHQEKNATPDRLPQSGDNPPVGLPPTSERLTLR